MLVRQGSYTAPISHIIKIRGETSQLLCYGGWVETQAERPNP